MIKEIVKYEFDNYVIKSRKPLVIVDFWAPWCAPCKAMNPILESISRKFTLQLDIIKINVDDESQFAAKGGITSIPTLLFYKGGKEVKKLVGMQTEMELTGIISDLLA